MTPGTLDAAASLALMRQRRARNRAILAVLVGLVVLFYVITIVKVGH